MNATLIAVNSKYIHSSLSVRYLSAAVRKSCQDQIRIEVLEFTINQSQETVLYEICERKPDVMAFSCYIWNISFNLELIRRITKKLPGVPVILGGPEVSYNSEEILSANPDVDFIIMGEGEIPFPELLSRLQDGKDSSDIAGLCYRNNNGGVTCNKAGKPLSEPPTPYTPEFFQALSGRIAYLETSRGCPYSCAFCLSGTNGCSVRFFDMERAKKELILLANSGTQTIKLVDRTFNCNPSRAYELFQFIIENAGREIPKGVCFHFEVAADIFDGRTLDLLASAPAGLIQLEAGLQSFNAKVLKVVNRRTDLAKLEETIRMLLKNQNIHLHVDLIAGLPYEDLESFMESFDRAYFLSPHMLQLGFLKMLHGSDLRKISDDLGYIYSKEPPYEVMRTPWLSEKDLSTLRNAEHALQRFYNSGRFLLTLDYLLSATGMRPFLLFQGLGAALTEKTNVPLSLDDLTRSAFDYFTVLPNVHAGALRDAMVSDRIATGNKIPAFLKVQDKNLKSVTNYIRNTYFHGQKDLKIPLAILYAKKKRAIFSESSKSLVTGRCVLHYIPLDE